MYKKPKTFACNVKELEQVEVLQVIFVDEGNLYFSLVPVVCPY